MPTNVASGSWCTINLIEPSSSTASTSSSIDQKKIPCKEYKHETSTDPTTGAIREIVTIESQRASPFEIDIHVKPTAYSALHRPSTDGPDSTNQHELLKPDDYYHEFFLDGISIGAGTRPKTVTDSWKIAQVHSGDYEARSLQFASVDLVDPDDHPDQICQDEKVIKSLGTIQINITRCTAVYQTRLPFANHHTSTSNQMKFSERSKKARLATTAGLAPVSTCQQPFPAQLWTPIAWDPQPFLQFIFKYKPRSILETEGLIKPEIIIEVDSDKENECKKEKTKQEKNINGNNKRIKSEEGDQKKNRADLKDKKPKIVDLTLSDDSD
ncbi:hypothetical protein MJO29_001059 [Puccinia striiformis f. sp. tritici]|nr:hypothetical protein MJO29_001059 [Puccinia striiformis f. sp. tritici]